MGRIWRVAALCLLASTTLLPKGPSAKDLYKQGQKAERSGDKLRAYLLYSQAAALDPKQPKYWKRSEGLRAEAGVQANLYPKQDIEVPSSSPSAAEISKILAESGFSTTISEQDLEDVRRMRPPPVLAAGPERKNIDLRGDAKLLFERVAQMYGLETIFDADYPAGPSQRLRLEDAGYREAIRALEAMTGSFVVPLNSRVILVAKDTQQKRTELEPVVAVSIPMPNALNQQEITELARAVQQTMEIRRLAIDPDRNMILIQDRISRVLPAQELFMQLSYDKPMVEIEMQFMEVDRSSTMSYGLLMPSQFPLVWLGSNPVKGIVQNMAKFLYGQQFIGLGIASAHLFANMTRATSDILIDTNARTLSGAPAVFHVGDEYPILTGGFLGEDYDLPPAFNFEKLGLAMKVTPHVHGAGEVSLELQSEFKMLKGESLNGIPVISSRKLEANVRLRNGEWAVVAGLMSVNEARAISGVAGLSNLPLVGRLLRKNDKTDVSTEILVLLKPRLLSLPPEEYLTRAVYAGPNMRLRIPL